MSTAICGEWLRAPVHACGIRLVVEAMTKQADGPSVASVCLSVSPDTTPDIHFSRSKPGWPWQGEAVGTTISRDTPDDSPSGYWSGRAWPPTNFFVPRGLLNYSFFDVADELLRRWMSQIATCAERPVQYIPAPEFPGRPFSPALGPTLGCLRG